MEQLKELMKNLLYPELRPYGRGDQDRLLREARQEPFDFLEWAGILGSLVVVVAVTRYSIAELAPAARFATAIVNFIVAVPLIVLMAGPFFVRRTKRGLKRRLP
jgi:hypothetical protein